MICWRPWKKGKYVLLHDDAVKKRSKNERAIELLVRGVLVQNGHLLVCRNRRKGNVYLPGGHIEWGETATQALRREMREELGQGVRVGRFLGGCEYTFMEDRHRIWEINLCFAMYAPRLRAPKAPRSAEGKIEFFWIPLRRVPHSELLPNILRAHIPRWVKRGCPSWISPTNPSNLAHSIRASRLPKARSASRLRFHRK